MIQPINKDIIFLSQKAELATKKDSQVCKDLLDTLKAHSEECVGMAANMIGVNKRIIVVAMGKAMEILINPEIVKKTKPFETEEGCLSLTGTRPTIRYEEITVTYFDQRWHKHTDKFTGWTAQIIQHEIDHCEGIII